MTHCDAPINLRTPIGRPLLGLKRSPTMTRRRHWSELRYYLLKPDPVRIGAYDVPT
jgi:hypothetical protein